MAFFTGVSHPLTYTSSGGAAAEDDAALERRIELMHRCGVEWILCDVPFPFDGAPATPSADYLSFKKLIARWKASGFSVLGVTPYPAGFADGWNADVGTPGSERFLRAYHDACRFLASELADTVSAWLIANQLNLERFRRPLTERQAISFVVAGGVGVKAGNPRALVGVNMFGFDKSALAMYARLYPNQRIDFDYVGSNGFFGTFDPGGPESWHEKLAILKGITKKPVIVLECGYPSRGDVMAPEEHTGGLVHHELKKLPFAWGSGHTPQIQAEYLQRVFWTLRNTPDVLGAFWFCWTDRPQCWNCGQPDCPAGTAHGLVDLQQKPKPAFEAFARAARGEFEPASLYPDEEALASNDTSVLKERLSTALARGASLEGEIAYLRKSLLLSRERTRRAERPTFARMLSWLLRDGNGPGLE
jgi:hypothetical protein